MPPRNVHKWRSGLRFGLFLLCVAASAPSLRAQELVLKREYPGSGPYQCPAPLAAPLPAEDGRLRAAQLATDANQALALGEVERAQELLEQARELDTTSPDYAYRHANLLEALGRTEAAIEEYCSAIDLDVQSIGITGVRQQIDILWTQIRLQLPEGARNAFAAGVAAADDSLYVESVESFSEAIQLAPGWPDPVYNRAAVNEAAGNIALAVVDYRSWLLLVSDPDASDAIAISQRIGELEGAASLITPSPAGALALAAIPGMGHYYTRRPVSGTITLAAAGAAIAAGVLFKERTTLCLEEVPSGSPCPDGSIVDQMTDTPYLWYGVGVAAAFTIAGAIEAYIKAKRVRDATNAIFETAPAAPDEGLTVQGPSISTYRDQVDVQFLRLRFR